MQGNLEFLYAAFQDEKNLLGLLDAASQGIMICDENGHIVLVNNRVQEMLGYAGSELIGQHLSIMLPEYLHHIHRIHERNYIAHPYTRQMGRGMNLVAKRKDGTVIPVEVGLSYVKSEHGLLVMALITDISERKRLEEEAIKAERLRADLEKEREMRQMKSQFISMIVHDFRNPLSVIRTGTEILTRAYHKNEIAKYFKHFERIQQNIQHLDRMIEQLLTVGQIESGQVIFAPRPMNLRSFCLEITRRLREVNQGEHPILFTFDCTHEIFVVDPNLLDHVLTNLLLNAVKYSGDNREEIRLEAIEEPDHLIFNVHDHGIGIPEKDHTHVFEPFNRAGNTGKIPGTGLGLTIARQYTELHEGTIGFQSQENAGSVFTVRIPKVLPD